MKYPAKFLSALSLVTATAAFPMLAQAAPDTKNVIMGAHVPWVPMAEWETAPGQVSVATGAKEVAKAPKSAVKYRAKTFALPDGTIHLLEFTKKGGGVLHKIGTETELFVLKGDATVGVNGADEMLGAGDAVNIPSGVLRGKPGDAEDATVFVWNVGSTVKTPASAVVRGADQKEMGLPAQPGQASVKLKRYSLDGNSIRYAVLTGPGHTPANTHDTASVLYLLSGHMRLTMGDTVTDIKPGDALIEPVGVSTSWEVLEPSSFLSTSGWVGPSPAEQAK
jgi:quercetin dioxygenase-like cupin family protein